MGHIYEHFAFKIGDIVQLKVHCGETNRKMQIIERLYVECPGGVQLFYSVVQSGHNPARFIETILEPYVLTQAEIDGGEWSSRRLERMLSERAKPKTSEGERAPD